MPVATKYIDLVPLAGLGSTSAGESPADLPIWYVPPEAMRFAPALAGAIAPPEA